jgi:hypothetical protein
MLERLRDDGFEGGVWDDDPGGDSDSDIDDDSDEGKFMLGLMMIEEWLAQYLRPEPLPQIIDSTTGEPMLFTTDTMKCSIGPH